MQDFGALPMSYLVPQSSSLQDRHSPQEPPNIYKHTVSHRVVSYNINTCMLYFTVIPICIVLIRHVTISAVPYNHICISKYLVIVQWGKWAMIYN